MRKLRITHNPSLITPTSKVQLKDKIYVAGHRGLAGSALVRRLRAAGFANLLCRTHAELDLTDQRAVRSFFADEKPDYIFIAAAKVGGIHANNTQPADFIFQNLAIEKIAFLVRDTIGDQTIELEYTPSDDNRSYHVNSDKVKRVLGFEPYWTIENAIQDVCDAFDMGLLANPDDDRFYNVKTLKAAYQAGVHSEIDMHRGARAPAA